MKRVQERGVYPGSCAFLHEVPYIYGFVSALQRHLCAVREKILAITENTEYDGAS